MQRLDIAWEDIYSTSLKLLQPLTLRQTYKTVVKEAIKLLDADQGTVIMYKNKQLVRVYASFSAIKKYEVSPRGRTYQALGTGEPNVSIVRTEEDIQPEVYKFGFQTIIFIPFTYGIKTKGVLNIFTKDRVKLLHNEKFKLRLFGTMISEAFYKADQFERAENAIKARDHFIAMASHELKNPLTSILMNAQLAKKIYSNGQTPDERLLDSLVTQSLWLSKLIDETLNIHKLRRETIGIYKEAVSVLEVVHLAVLSFRATYPYFNVTVTEEIANSEAYVHADFYKLLQVFVNILNNAAKYSANEKSIVVSLVKNKSNVTIKITDKGIGISKKDLPKIFEGYYQGGMKNHGGMGLGLFLVKQIVEDANGHVSIQSKENQGTTVSISLPIYART